jgi:hypothetical protein
MKEDIPLPFGLASASAEIRAVSGIAASGGE